MLCSIRSLPLSAVIDAICRLVAVNVITTISTSAAIANFIQHPAVDVAAEAAAVDVVAEAEAANLTAEDKSADDVAAAMAVAAAVGGNTGSSWGRSSTKRHLAPARRGVGSISGSSGGCRSKGSSGGIHCCPRSMIPLQPGVPLPRRHSCRRMAAAPAATSIDALSPDRAAGCSRIFRCRCIH